MHDNHFFLPPEWSPQSAILLTWPNQTTIWADMMDEIDVVFVNVVVQVAKRQRVVITCYDETHQDHILKLLKEANANLKNVFIYQVKSNDIWVRDHGPLTVLHADKPILLDFTFNGWGNKYPAEEDNELTRNLHRLDGLGQSALQTIDMVLEGGAIEVDGKGTLLTTTHCLLSPNRNPHLTKEQITEQLKKILGVNRILWLEHGALEGDDTDGHIDTLARFTDPHTICYVTCSDKNDPHYADLKRMEQELQSFVDYQGNPYRLIPLPFPKARYAKFDGRRLPATYANFLIINDAVLVPTYDDPSDDEALKTIAACFPERQIIPITCTSVVEWYGSLHCMTMQLPRELAL